MESSSAPGGSLLGVPADIWHTVGFQNWYRAQSAAGNSLEQAKLLWSLRVGDGSEEPFLWVMQVAVHVAAEGRVKANEVVVFRPDVSAVALYRAARCLDETVVVLVREFRSPASTADGFVRELPSGSGAESDARAQAAAELVEETGFTINPDRLRGHGSRQAAATLAAHHVHLFSASISEDELEWLRARRHEVQGDGHGQERTWIEITTFGEIRRSRSVDWTTLGLLTQALLEETAGIR
jgi:8-oxo-dGTP pyrophosphatase MutT (NUDIX family)